MLELTMLVLAVLMVPLVILQETIDDETVIRWTEWLSGAIWFAFVAEYLYLLLHAPEKRLFVTRHWFDLLIIVVTPPLVFVPEEIAALRSLRVVRLVRLVAVTGRAQHTLRKLVRRDSLPYLLLLSGFVVITGGLAIRALEPETAATIGDGIWWAAATLSTVGYGDIAPSTLAGRIVAVIVMIVGVGTFAGLTAAIASFFVEESGDDMAAELRRINARLEEIESRLSAGTRTGEGG